MHHHSNAQQILKLCESEPKTIARREKNTASKPKSIPAGYRDYFSRNPGAVFVIAFEFLIFTCACLLVLDNPLINEVTVLAFCLLLVGVVIQAFSFLKERS